MKWSVRFVHKISPRDTDTMDPITVPNGAFSDRKTVGKALRAAKVLNAGDRVSHFRVEGDRVVVFPVGSCMIWHSIILQAQA
jgi:hypothetical protein